MRKGELDIRSKIRKVTGQTVRYEKVRTHLNVANTTTAITLLAISVTRCRTISAFVAGLAAIVAKPLCRCAGIGMMPNCEISGLYSIITSTR